MKYSIEQFLNDLTKIKNNTFKTSIIRHVFEKFEMWSINEKQCIKQLKHFNKHVETTKFTLSLLRQIHDLIDIQHELKNQWDLKIAENMQRNDFVREEKFRDFINNTKQMIVNSLFKETKLQMWQTTRQKELNRKKFFRKRLRFETDNLRLIKENAKQVILAKLQKEKNDEKKRIDVQFMKFWRMKRNDVHAKNVVARKTKKARIKQIKEMTKVVFLYLLNCCNSLMISKLNEKESMRRDWSSKKRRIERKSHVSKNQ
jgi:hypothetical protein